MSDEVPNHIKGRRLRAPRFVRSDGVEPEAVIWVAEAEDGGETWAGVVLGSEHKARQAYADWVHAMNHDARVPQWESEAVDKATGKMNPRVIVRDCVAACPDLEHAPIVEIVTAVIESGGAALKEIEKEIEDAGGSTPNVCAVLMGVGAVFEVARQLPGTRGQLVEAGRVVGRAMADRYEVSIKKKIAEQQGGN